MSGTEHRGRRTEHTPVGCERAQRLFEHCTLFGASHQACTGAEERDRAEPKIVVVEAYLRLGNDLVEDRAGVARPSRGCEGCGREREACAHGWLIWRGSPKNRHDLVNTILLKTQR